MVELFSIKRRNILFLLQTVGTSSDGQLANEGCKDWKHLGEKLKAHEISKRHIESMQKWLEAVKQMSRVDGIDIMMLEHIKKEKLHWRGVLTRILAVVQYLSEHNIAFRGKTEKLYSRDNGNFLGLIQMLVTFDPVMEEHVR